MWTKYKPSLNHIRMFGCDYYVHVPFKLRKNCTTKLKFINYLVIVKMWRVVDYMIYNPTKSLWVEMWCLMDLKPILIKIKTSGSRLSYNLQWRVNNNTLQCKPPSITTYSNPKSYPTTKCCTTNNSSTRWWQCKQWKHSKKFGRKYQLQHGYWSPFWCW